VGFRELEISLEKMRKRVDRLPKLVLDLTRIELLRIGNIAARRAAELTPRDTGATAEGWVARQRDLKQSSVVRVVNTNPKANEEIVLQGGGSTTLLEILEFGSSPHEIRPKDKKVLKFQVGGQTIYTKGPIFHPGTAPHNMVTIASVEAAVNAKKLVDALRVFIRQQLRVVEA